MPIKELFDSPHKFKTHRKLTNAEWSLLITWCSENLSGEMATYLDDTVGDGNYFMVWCFEKSEDAVLFALKHP